MLRAMLLICAIACYPQISRAKTAGDTYGIALSRDGFAASNPDQGLIVRFHDGHTDFIHNGSRFSLALTGEAAVSHASARGNRVEFTRGLVTEWFLNGPDGVEQGFTVAARRGQGALELTLRISGDYLPALEGGAVVLRKDGRTILRYAALHSWDADGRRLPSRAQVEGNRIRLLVDDSDARYPVTVDPVVQQAKLLPLQSGKVQLGDSVAVSGDTMVVGALEANGSAGGASVFTRTGGVWNSGVELLQPDPNSNEGRYGAAVAVSGGIAVVGAPGNGYGAIYVFTGSGSTWRLQAEIQAPLNADGNPVGQDFGTAVAVSGNTIIAGMHAIVPDFPPGAKPAGGFAVVYTLAGKGAWGKQQTLTGPPTTSSDGFGDAIALEGDTAVMGARDSNGRAGGVWVFKRTGATWAAELCVCGSGITSLLTASDAKSLDLFGNSVALSGDTLIVGAPGRLLNGPGTRDPGKAYVFTRTSGIWSQQAKLLPANFQATDLGRAVAISGDVAVVVSTNLDPSVPSALQPTAHIFVRSTNLWPEQTTLDLPLTASIVPIAIDAGTLVAGSPYDGQSGTVSVYQISNVSLLSNPAGRGFSLSGTGCGPTGAFTTPYAGLWSNCTVTWASPDAATPGARYSFQRWEDGGTQNPRTLSPPLWVPAPYSYTGDFLTEYQLSTISVTASGGSVTGAGWYAAGTSATSAAVPNPGFLFTGFTGGLSGFTNPQSLVMNAPVSVTGNFTATPPAVLTGSVTAKSGTAAQRVWTISLANTGPGTAYNTQLFVLAFAQTFGTACVALPVRVTPAALPLSLGNLAPNAAAQTQAALDFSGCPLTARFTVSLGYMSNGGASGGLIQLVNQFQ